MSDPDSGSSLVVVVGIEGHNFLGQNHMIGRHGGLQVDVDRHFICKIEQLQQHRLHGVQTQRERSCDQIPERGQDREALLPVTQEVVEQQGRAS